MIQPNPRVLHIPFRDIPGLNIPFIIFFYAAEFSFIGIAFNGNRKMGFVVLVTYFAVL